LEDEEMTYLISRPQKISSLTCPAARILTALIILALLSLGTFSCAAAQTSTDPARSHCVSSGYLYRITPSVNGGQPVCSFPDNSWCDVNEFYKGSCGPRITANILPSYAFETDTQKATKSMQEICFSSGGKMKSIHTPYGDIAVCTFPDGTTCDARTISEGRCGMDEWMIYARSWLNAP
jgi:putative hemolysin